MSSALKIKKQALEKRRLSLKEKFAQPQYVLEQMASFLKEGDVASITDLISAYVSNSEKYKNQEEFAEAIGTTRQTLHRMFSHSDAVSIKVFFGAVGRIYEDANQSK